MQGSTLFLIRTDRVAMLLVCGDLVWIYRYSLRKLCLVTIFNLLYVDKAMYRYISNLHVQLLTLALLKPH